MKLRFLGLVALTSLFLVVAASLNAADPAEATPAKSDDAQRLANKIDELIAAEWTANDAKAATPAEDAEFCQRIYLDIAGRIPRVSKTTDFLEDNAPSKPRKLLDSPSYLA
ncbi:MAG: DUF1549 domain-containing protein [Gemmataceae bacterium]|nr:DUF1549 domain-containing protein [Gemmataceae bacterium]